MALSVHSDNPYRDPVPGIQLLHCLENDAQGGDTILVDDFNAAARLRKESPDAFAILTRNWVTFRYNSANTELITRAPMISVDDRGQVIGIRFNNRSLAPLDLPADQIPGFYKAYRQFADILFDPASALTFKLAPGELFAVDNRRILHGRTAFSAAGKRHLQGCYADMDGLLSKLAVLERV
jgi:gamma-butyrobetaine dioxygenase